MRELTCPICRIQDAIAGQTVAVAIALLRAAAKVPCRCPGHTHEVLYLHPHTEPGCVGFVPEDRR